MINKISLVVVAGLLVLAASTATFAQRDSSGSYRIVSNDNVVGLVPGQLARLYIVNGIDPTLNVTTEGNGDSAVTGGAKGHVRAFSLNGNLQIASLTSAVIEPGQVGTIDIKYADLEGIETDPQTGRREFRVELTIDFTGLESDARKIRSSLKSLEGGRTVLVGMLLPAIQKVR